MSELTVGTILGFTARHVGGALVGGFAGIVIAGILTSGIRGDYSRLITGPIITTAGIAGAIVGGVFGF
jgi:hypothetical protein